MDLRFDPAVMTYDVQLLVGTPHRSLLRLRNHFGTLDPLPITSGGAVKDTSHTLQPSLSSASHSQSSARCNNALECHESLKPSRRDG